MGTSRVRPPSSEGVHGFGKPPKSGYDRGESLVTIEVSH